MTRLVISSPRKVQCWLCKCEMETLVSEAQTPEGYVHTCTDCEAKGE